MSTFPATMAASVSVGPDDQLDLGEPGLLVVALAVGVVLAGELDVLDPGQLQRDLAVVRERRRWWWSAPSALTAGGSDEQAASRLLPPIAAADRPATRKKVRRETSLATVRIRGFVIRDSITTGGGHRRTATPEWTAGETAGPLRVSGLN